MLININSQSTYWGRCDSSQPAKASPGGAAPTDGFFCNSTYVAKLNEMLCSLNYCTNLQAKRAFIGQVTHESAYFTKFYQPIDNGRGALHMLPANMPTNVQDIQAKWPGSNAQTKYSAQGAPLLTTPEFAWLSAASWFLSTNRVIPNCNLNLFLTDFATTSRCIFGGGTDPGAASRQQAYNYAVQFIVQPSASTNFATSSSSPSLLWLLFLLVLASC